MKHLTKNSFFNDDFDFMPSCISNKFEEFPTLKLENVENGYNIKITIPNMNKENFDVYVEDSYLVVEYKNESSNEEKDEDKYVYKEFSSSSFKKSFKLPKDVDADDIDATFTKNGINIFVPVPEQLKENRNKRITIK